MSYEDEKETVSIIGGESISAKVEMIHSKNPKIVMSVRITADLEKIDKVPQMVADTIKNISDEASKHGINLNPVIH